MRFRKPALDLDEDVQDDDQESPGGEAIARLRRTTTMELERSLLRLEELAKS